MLLALGFLMAVLGICILGIAKAEGWGESEEERRKRRLKEREYWQEEDWLP